MSILNYAAMCLGYLVVGVAVICMAAYLLNVALTQCRDIGEMTTAWWQFLVWRRERKKPQPPKEKES